ncbi:MAG: PD-(D/E)XK nuclease family protein [Anaerolineales bacterium]
MNGVIPAPWYEGVERIPTFSWLSALAECPRLFALRYRHWLRTREETFHLTAGTIGHAACNEWLTTADMGAAQKLVAEMWPKDWFVAPPGQTTVPVMQAAVVAACRALEKLGLPEAVLIPIEICEQPVTGWVRDPLTGDMFPLGGRMDVVPFREPGGRTVIADLKFSIYKPSTWWLNRQKYATAMQLKVYAALAKEFWGVDVDGGMVLAINASGKEGTPVEVVPAGSGWTNDTLDEALAWAAGLLREYHERVSLENGLVGEKTTGQTQDVLEMPASWRSLAAWPMNPRACMGCAFNEFCGASTGRRAAILTQLFERRPPSADKRLAAGEG